MKRKATRKEARPGFKWCNICGHEHVDWKAPRPLHPSWKDWKKNRKII